MNQNCIPKASQASDSLYSAHVDFYRKTPLRKRDDLIPQTFIEKNTTINYAQVHIH